VLMRAKSKGLNVLDEATAEQIEEARKYIDLNSAYFPIVLRKHMLNASSSLAALGRNFGRVDGKAELKSFEQASTILLEAQEAIEAFIDKFNLLNRDH